MLRNWRRPTVGLIGAALVLTGSTLAWAGAHTWDVFEVFSDCTGNIQFIELKETNGTPGETGLTFGTVTSTTRSFSIGGPGIAAPTTFKHFLIATPAFAALPGAPTPDRTLPANLVPFVTVGGPDTITYVPYDSMAIAAGTLPTNGTNSLTEGIGSAVNSPTNYSGQTGSINVSCATIKGDVDGNGARDGRDISAYVRVVTGAPIAGDQVFCAEYCLGSVAANTTAFVNDLLL